MGVLFLLGVGFCSFCGVVFLGFLSFVGGG